MGNKRGSIKGRENLPDCECKVGRVSRETGLHLINEELVGRWGGEHSETMSVRELADYFNEQVLQKILSESDTRFIGAEASDFYSTLSSDPEEGEPDDGVTKADRDNLVSELEDAGFDVDKILTNYFLSYQSIYSHLTDCLEVSAPSSKSKQTSLNDDKDTVRRVQSRAVDVGQTYVSRHTEGLSGGDPEDRFEVRSSVTVRCNECGYKKPVVRFLSDGGCYCDDINVPKQDGGAENH